VLARRALEHVPPGARVLGASCILDLSVVAWPVTSLTVFASEPQGILGLSWLALILTCVDIVCTTDVRREQDA
jgi:hypothetical protein